MYSIFQSEKNSNQIVVKDESDGSNENELNKENTPVRASIINWPFRFLKKGNVALNLRIGSR